MIGGPDGEVMNDVGMRRPIVIRRDVHCEGHPSSARLSFSAYGLVECEINGVKVGTDVLTPGWTVYDRRLPCAAVCRALPWDDVCRCAARGDEHRKRTADAGHLLIKPC